MNINKFQKVKVLILIVDDLEENRILLSNLLLNSYDLETVTAKNGLEAIKIIKNQRIDLILMDMEMPVMDGYSATRIISALSGTKQIPIIAMTAHEGTKENEKCLKAGCCDYLKKPVTGRDLFNIIQKHLKHYHFSAKDHNNFYNIPPEIMALVPAYLENRMNDARKISQFIEKGDFPGIEKIAHAMAGSGGGYGFDEISIIGTKIERAAEKRDIKEIISLNRRLSEYLSTLSKEINNKKY